MNKFWRALNKEFQLVYKDQYTGHFKWRGDEDLKKSYKWNFTIPEVGKRVWVIDKKTMIITKINK
jgi:hypothetical protein